MKKSIVLLFLCIFLCAFPALAADDLATITRDDGVTLRIESFAYQDTAGSYTPANGAYLVMLMTIDNPTDDEQCIRASNIRLLYDDEEYPPERALMGAVQREMNPRRDYVGPLAGHCVDAGESAPSFAAFDVPADMDSFAIRFDETTQHFTDLEPIDPPPSPTPRPTVEQPTENPSTPRPTTTRATATPRPAASSESADATTLSDGIFLGAGGRDVQTVQVTDGRDKGGERGAIIAYIAHATEQADFVDEFIDILRAVAATIRAEHLDLDAITLVVGTPTGEAAGMIVVQVDDLLDYHQGRLTQAQFIERIQFTSL